MQKNGALLWLRKTTNTYRPMLILLTMFEIMVSLLGVCYALVMKQMVDHAVAKDSHGFVLGMMAFGLLVVIQLSLRMVTRQLSEAARSGMENTLKKNLFSALLKKDYGSICATHSEDWMNRLTSDTAVCANGRTDIVPGFMGMMIRLIGSLALIFWLQPGLSFLVIPGGIVFLIITVVLRKPIKRYHKEVQEKDGRVRVYLQERISSMLVVRSFGVEDVTLEQTADTMELHKTSRMKKAWISNICSSGFSLAINGMYLLGIGYCGYGIMKGNVSFGTLTAMIQLIGQLQSPLASLGGYVPKVFTTIASAERLMEVEQYEEVNVTGLRSECEVRTLYEEQIREIVFANVSFHYPKGQDHNPLEVRADVLKNMSVTINKGDYVAITGISGCGKSTMLKLLMGLYEPQSGVIKVILKDGTGISIKEMKWLFAYVPQGNFLMGGSIRDAVTFGKSCEKDKLDRVMHLACAEFVYDLPEQLDTMLGEKGAGLSEGQMLRIAIARALYADRPVLILDEATSALDEATEEQLLKHLKTLTDKTVLLVTHRAKAQKICNKSLILEASGEVDRRR